MSTTSAFQRTPLVISAGNLVAGPVNAAFRDGDPGSLLHSYLVLVRQLRGQQREATITLRSADINALAVHLGSSDERVLDDLLDRMGATRAQRRAFAAMFALGALTIVASGSVALEFSSSGASAEGRIGDTAPVAIVQPNPSVTTAAQASPAEIEALVEAPAASLEPELAVAGAGVDWDVVVAVHLLKQSLAEPSTDGPTSSTGVGSGVADDGSVVAVGTPPVPPVPAGGGGGGGDADVGVGVADDGSIVAVGTPPVPPVEGADVDDAGIEGAGIEGVGVADDGSIVAVGTPPTPPPTLP